MECRQTLWLNLEKGKRHAVKLKALSVARQLSKAHRLKGKGKSIVPTNGWKMIILSQGKARAGLALDYDHNSHLPFG